MGPCFHFVYHLLLIAALPSLTAAGGQGQPMDEYQVKAAFLYNFAKFVEWPADTFQSANEPIAICVLGPDPFGQELESAVKGKTIDGRRLVARRISDIRQAGGCRILFALSPERRHLSSIFAGIKEAGVLTVGEGEESSPNGAIINFMLESGKVRFEVHVDAAEREKVRLSSKLLSLARKVKK
jgi:hypothetical protein